MHPSARGSDKRQRPIPSSRSDRQFVGGDGLLFDPERSPTHIRWLCHVDFAIALLFCDVLSASGNASAPRKTGFLSRRHASKASFKEFEAFLVP